MDSIGQVTQTVQITPISPAQAQSVFIGILENIIGWLQGVSPVYFAMMIIIGAFMWVLGALFASKDLKTTAGSTILLAVIGYLIVINAQTLLGVVLGFGPN